MASNYHHWKLIVVYEKPQDILLVYFCGFSFVYLLHIISKSIDTIKFL